MIRSDAPHVIEVSHLTRRFGDIVAVRDVSFAVDDGATAALLGGNGAGKTTTLSILLGLLLPTSGTVRVFGEDMVRHRHRVLPRMNFSSPYVDLPKRLSVRENLTIFGHLYGLDRLDERIAALSRDLELGAFLDRPHGSLSSGQVTRVSLAKALLNEPRLLILDEPTVSLDPDTGDWVRSFLESYRDRTRATILLASHNMAEVERMCDQVMMMRDGVIIDSGTPGELIHRYGRKSLEEVFLDIARRRNERAGGRADKGAGAKSAAPAA